MSNKKEVKTRLEKLQEKQIEYWQTRAENNFLAGEKDAFDVAKDLKSLYNNAVKEINEKIEVFYGKYTEETGLSLEEAKQLLNKSELKDFKHYLNECIKYKKENDIPTKQYELLKLKTKISRLDELETQIQFELDKLTNASKDEIQELLYNTYEEGYYKTIFDKEQFVGHSSPFSGLNKQAIGKAVDKKYLGENYSSLIWKNQNKLMTILNQEIPRGITLGYNPRKLAAEVISKRVDKQAYNNTVRLIRTEYSKILNDATLSGYKASRIHQYKLLVTLDNRTSEICQLLDEMDEVYEIDEAETGVNYPPFHPNCRTTTVPYFEPDEIDDMSEDELSNIGYITYDDWKSGLVKLEGNKVVYKEKSVKVEKTVDENGFERIGKTAIELDGMNEDYINDIEKQLVRLNGEFNSNLYSVKYNPDVQRLFGNIQMAETKGNKLQTSIVINGYGDKKEFGELLSKQIKMGHIVPVKEDDYGKYLVTHEFGHAITAYNLTRGEKIKINDLHREYIIKVADLEIQIRDKNKEFINNPSEELSKEIKNIREELSNITISNYARFNSDEFMAECFAYKILVGDDNKFVNDVYDIIKESNKNF